MRWRDACRRRSSADRVGEPRPPRHDRPCAVPVGARLASMLNRIVLIVFDGLGVGAPSDVSGASAHANTLAHAAEAAGGLDLTTLEALGLGHIVPCPRLTA